MMKITGRFAGTMRGLREDVGFVGPLREVTDGIIHIDLVDGVGP